MILPAAVNRYTGIVGDVFYVGIFASYELDSSLSSLV